MKTWLHKNENCIMEEIIDISDIEGITVDDSIFSYLENDKNGSFLLQCKYTVISNDLAEKDTEFEPLEFDLPYTLYYKTKSGERYIELSDSEKKFILNIDLLPNTTLLTEDETDIFKNFLKRLESFSEDIELNNVYSNIIFNIGQPNTGKSYNFEETRIFDGVESKYYKYLKIPVSGGVGNEYKGLQNTDLAITYDPIKKKLRFGEFLQMLMSAIVNPKVPHVVFLDDFHNQDISSLLSEYTPLFKGQQKMEVSPLYDNHKVFSPEFKNVYEFIIMWNDIISNHCADMPIVPITNRISGDSLKLVYPSNFYLLGAANFNENSLNIFADWEDRAKITYIDPIKSFMKKDENDFLDCCKDLNNKLKDILIVKEIFDYEKYCFGMWKIVNSDGTIVEDLEEQKKLIDFLFGMIKNALKFNNKNSEINDIGWKLMQEMQTNKWFTRNIEALDTSPSINYEILHRHNIYEEDI